MLGVRQVPLRAWVMVDNEARWPRVAFSVGNRASHLSKRTVSMRLRAHHRLPGSRVRLGDSGLGAPVGHCAHRGRDVDSAVDSAVDYLVVPHSSERERTEGRSRLAPEREKLRTKSGL